MMSTGWSVMALCILSTVIQKYNLWEKYQTGGNGGGALVGGGGGGCERVAVVWLNDECLLGLCILECSVFLL